MKKSNLNEVKRVQQLAGINESQLNEGSLRHFVVIIFEGDDDELGTMKGISASNQEEFEQKLKNIYGKEGLYDIKKHPEDTYWTFYETSKEEMDKIVQMSQMWQGGNLETEENLENIAKKGKPFSEIIFN